SDNHAPERMLLDTETRLLYSTLLSHEFTHSWNGKSPRPADMIVDDFQKPIRTRELWVYEGLTEYYGMVLAARCGLYTPEQFHDHLGVIVEWAKNQKGRTWRPLEDTAVAAQLLYPAPHGGQARRRGVDFYDEGVLVWLDADTLIREMTQGKKSLDDFCRRFHGGTGGAPGLGLQGGGVPGLARRRHAHPRDDPGLEIGGLLLPPLQRRHGRCAG